jgi:acyl-coenzyme A thioesterase PaaI-like protein
MKPVNNPYIGHDGYFCFGCDPGNPIGLKLSFVSDGSIVESRWEPDERFQGYHNVLHGGIQTTLMDEIASWLVFRVLGTAGMTRSINVTFHSSARTDGGPIELRAELLQHEKKRAVIRCLLSQDGEVRSEAVCDYAIVSPEIARRRFAYPGADAFTPPD